MKIIHSFLNVLILVLLICCKSAVAAEAQNKSPQNFPVNLSTPEKTVQCFYDAFRTGNRDLLTHLVIEGGSYAEFSPQYKIEAQNPLIAGVEIARKTAVKKWSGYGEPIEADDVLVYVITRKDPKLIVRKPGVAVPDETFCFLVRKVYNEWKLVKVYAGWPTFINH